MYSVWKCICESRNFSQTFAISVCPSHSGVTGIPAPDDLEWVVFAFWKVTFVRNRFNQTFKFPYRGSVKRIICDGSCRTKNRRKKDIIYFHITPPKTICELQDQPTALSRCR